MKINKFTVTLFSLIFVQASLISIMAYQRAHKELEIAYRRVRAASENIDVTILSTGSVEPKNRVEIKPPVSGRVERVFVKEGDWVRKGQILAWMSSTERAVLLDAARARGKHFAKRWRRDYRPTPILAPISGRIISRNVEPGQSFTNLDPVLVMSDRLTVKTQVDETDIAHIHVRQPASVTLDAYSESSVSGIVDQISFEAKTVNNVTTYVVDVYPTEIPTFMRSGMTANVTFHVKSRHNVVTVPSEAIRVNGDKYSVLVPARGQKKPIERSVEVGLSDGKKTEITHGLKEGDVIFVAELKGEESPQGMGAFSPLGGKAKGR